MSTMDILTRTRNNPKPFYTDSQTLNSSVPRKSFNQPRKANSSVSQKLCKFWVNGKCAYGDNCKFLHSWYLYGNGFSMLARLQGHKKPVVGIALPSGSDKLYTGGRDGTVRIWDCQSGNCDRVINFGVEIESFICEGSWVFIGLPNSVRVWNLSEINEIKEFSLDGPVGRVYALAVYKDMLFAGTANGDILVWKGSFEVNPFKLVATLRAHNKAVVCLNVSETNRLYSGSMDNTVKVWDLQTLQCKQTLKGHSDVVMSLLSWDRCLLTCSLDHTIKFWVAREGGQLEAVHTKQEKSGILKVFGMQDAQGKPVVFCSCNDNCVRLYELESFTERDRIFAEQEVREIQRGPGGLFFTGDATGAVTVWMWQQAETSNQNPDEMLV